MRRRQAQATRDAILRAARQLFARSGYQATTIDAIASKAQVSAPTVYLTFGSKAAILNTLVASAGSDPDLRALAAGAHAESDPVRRLQKAAHLMRLLMERERDLVDLLWQAGSGEDELVAAWRQMHANRHRALTGALAPLVEGRTAAARGRAIDAAWAISSPEVYRLLVTERGWTPPAFERWLADSLVSQVLD